MDDRELSTICDQVYNRYPEVNGVRPKLQPMAKGGVSQQVLIFTGKAKAENGKSISRIVRVVVGSNGKIVKMSTSK